MATAEAVKSDRGFTYDDYLIWDLGPYNKIKEYWVVNQDNEEIMVLVLDEGKYKTYGIFRDDDMISSKVLEGFSFKTKEVF